MREEVKRWN